MCIIYLLHELSVTKRKASQGHSFINKMGFPILSIVNIEDYKLTLKYEYSF